MYAMSIAGRWISADGRDGLAVENPSTGETLGRLPVATAEELDEALASAEHGFGLWRRVPAYDRSKILRRAADGIRAELEDLARALTREQGKVLAESRIELGGAADTFDWYAEEGRRAYGRIIPSRSETQRWLVRKEPVGPVAAFSPWNFPAMLSARKIAGALAAGCSCIIKPAEETPSPAIAFARILEAAGLPPGVLNVVFGVPSTISEHLIRSPIIKKISFTGSTDVGKHLARLAADGMKKGTYELGGHSPVLVFADADLDEVVRKALPFKFRNAGQMCISPTRFYVEAPVYRDFTNAFAEAASALRVGDGLDESSQMGSMANARRISAMEEIVADAERHGARIHTGGARIGNQGYFWQPTVMSDVPDEAIAMHREPFGPLALINAFETTDEALEKANRLPYGLAAYAFTTNSRTAMRVANELQSGSVGLNDTAVSIAECPFGGVKESGYGSEAGLEGLDAYLNTKFITET